MAKYYNQKHKERSYTLGDLVILSSKHVRIGKVSVKLQDRYLGPFKVLRTIGSNVYTLTLPKKYGRLYNTFYISLLEAYNKREGSKLPKPINIEREEEWEVE